MMKRSFITGVAGLFAMGAATGALAEVAGGDYVSLDGSLEHQFQRSGDYLGKVSGQDQSMPGVYREGASVCWRNKEDGSREPGDLLLYIGEVQCCLSTELISDKLAFTQVWVQGTGPGYQMCKNQVFRRKP